MPLKKKWDRQQCEVERKSKRSRKASRTLNFLWPRKPSEL
jgi:hypothetical protein